MVRAPKARVAVAEHEAGHDEGEDEPRRRDGDAAIAAIALGDVHQSR